MLEELVEELVEELFVLDVLLFELSVDEESVVDEFELLSLSALVFPLSLCVGSMEILAVAELT